MALLKFETAAAEDELLVEDGAFTASSRTPEPQRSSLAPSSTCTTLFPPPDFLPVSLCFEIPNKT